MKVIENIIVCFNGFSQYFCFGIRARLGVNPSRKYPELWENIEIVLILYYA